MVTVTRRAFSGGEIAPSLYARVDNAKYQTGLRTLRNMFVIKHGGASNRPGTTFIAEAKYPDKKCRVIEFIFNDEQTYVIEMGEMYLRFYRSGNRIQESTKVITGISQANPGVVTVTGHGYTTGQQVYMNNIDGMLEVNNRTFTIGVVTANTYELLGVDTTSYGAYTSGGTVEKVYEIATPYLEDELLDISYVQSADIITFAHNNHAPAELKRLADDNWVFSDISFTPEVDQPTNVSASGGVAGTGTFSRYKVTAVDADTSEESLPGTTAASTIITGATNADPVVVTSTAHGYTDNSEIDFKDVLGMTELNNRILRITNVTANTYEIENVDGTGYGTYISGGTARLVSFEIETGGIPTTADPITVTWDKPAGIQDFNIYKEGNGIYGLLSVVAGDSYEDIGVPPDTLDTPPSSTNPFIGTGNYPGAVTYIQQRLAFGNTDNKPESVFMSRTGNFKNFTKSKPLQEDDAFTFNVLSKQVNEVRNMLDLRGLVILTSGGEWGANGVISPTQINPIQHGYKGSSKLPPIIVGSSAVFLQARGSVIRDLSFDFSIDGYQGSDLTIFSSHLFDKHVIKDWSYQQIPNSILWVIREDGTLLGLTFIKEQQMIAWHRHDTHAGSFESCTVVPEGNEDVSYFSVKRTVNGQVKRYIEKFSTRQINNIVDMKFMDSNLTYDGRNTDELHTMEMTGGVTWEYSEKFSVVSNTAFFSAQDIGNEIHFEDSNGEPIRFNIEEFISSTEVKGKPNRTIPLNLRTTPLGTWSRAVDELVGLNHLEGEKLSILGDAFVVANPNNESYEIVEVVNGKAKLDKAYGVLHLGLPVTADIETLDIDDVAGALIDENELVTGLSLYVEETRGVWAGPKPPVDDTTNPIDGLTEFKLRRLENYSDPVSLKTQVINVNIKGEWNDNGRVFIRQIDPIPLTVLTIAAAGKFALGE